MSTNPDYRISDGRRVYRRQHPDQVLFDPKPGQATKDAWYDVCFEWHIQKLTEAAKRQREFEQRNMLTPLG